MLRFIYESLVTVHLQCAFQYIPCYGLSKPVTAEELGCDHFNTSHVTVYPNEDTAVILYRWSFQYIPCYGLSSATPHPNDACLHFNTSHVTVYRKKHYFLTSMIYISIHPMLRFIYDSLYDMGYSLYFNTSHVTVYQMIFRCLLRLEQHFNTSHVTVYRNTPPIGIGWF